MAYVLNHEKTDLSAALDYIGRSEKNTLPDGGTVLETALNCELPRALQDMRDTKRRWGKQGGVLGYHLIHAYAPGEVTPERAHSIGVEFAQRLLGDRYEAVVSTHLDRGHIHCHIVFNSVSFVDGKPWSCFWTIWRFRAGAMRNRAKLWKDLSVSKGSFISLRSGADSSFRDSAASRNFSRRRLRIRL